MNRLRELLQAKAWIGWVLALVLLGVSVVLFFRLNRSDNPYDGQRMVQTLTIKCIETGKEWQVRRGEMEKMLRGRGFQIDPLQGLPNPDTGKLTGFPKNEVWEETISRINGERRARQARGEVPAGAVDTPAAAEPE